MALPFTLKSIFRQKKNYGNSNISPCKNIIFQKISERNQNPSRYYNFVTNLKFQQKPKYHISKILISKLNYYLGGKIPKLLYSIMNLNTISLPTKVKPIGKMCSKSGAQYVILNTEIG
jgi:hypothetical protein